MAIVDLAIRVDLKEGFTFCETSPAAHPAKDDQHSLATASRDDDLQSSACDISTGFHLGGMGGL